jgi:uncharacterized cupin superfamily protein
MESVNIFHAENLDGRVDVAGALGSKATLMFIYDVAPGQRQSPYHYEYDEEWLLVVDGTLVLRAPDEEHTLERGTSSAELAFRRSTAVPWSDGEEGWD